MYHIFCIYSSVEGHVGSFQLLAIINKAAINIMEHVSLLHVGESSGYMTRSGIAGSSGSIMSNFLRNHQNYFGNPDTPRLPETESSTKGYTWLQSKNVAEECLVGHQWEEWSLVR